MGAALNYLYSVTLDAVDQPVFFVDAAAELSEVSSSDMMRAALDFPDGRIDTPEGRRVMDLMQGAAGAVLG